MSNEKTVEQIVNEWVQENETQPQCKGERNALKRCSTAEAAMESSSYRIPNLRNRLYNAGHKFSDSQIVCLGWAFSHVRKMDMTLIDEEHEIYKPFGEFLARHKINKARVDAALNPRDRETFIRHLILTLDRLNKEKIPASLVKDILYYGPKMKFRWRCDFNKIEMSH